jgi:UPF0755 protein
VSPVNSGESSGDDFSDSGRQLTRKEIRAREKSLASEGNDVVPPQAFETGHGPSAPHDTFPVYPAAYPTVNPADTPQVPAAPPSVHETTPEMPAEPPTVQVSEVPDAGTGHLPLLDQTHLDEAYLDQTHLDQTHREEHPVEGARPPDDAQHEDEAQHEDVAPYASEPDEAQHEDVAPYAGEAQHEDVAPYAGEAHSEDVPPYAGEAKHEAHSEAAGLPEEALDSHHSPADDRHLDPPLDPHLEPGHHDFGDHDEDEAHHVYDDADVYAVDDHSAHHAEEPGHHAEEPGHPLMAGRSSAAVVPAASKKVRRRRRLLALLLTLVVFVTALVVGAQFLKPLLGGDAVADYPGPGTGQVNVSVEPGEGNRSVATKLADQKVIANPDTFLRELSASGGTIAPGEFQFRQEMKNSDAIAIIVGKEQGKVMYIALSAGLRIGESLEAISQGSGIPVAELKALSNSPAQFGLPAKAKNLEGFLAPGEHRFAVGTPAKDILQKLVTTTTDELKAQGVTDPAKQYDVVTVASIVQAEGGQAEYGDVAGAIYNRLKANNTETAGLIQSDATVTYGLGIKSFHIDEDQKTDKSNPYNTYANQGLPVGPIGSPGKTAIDAAAKPKANEYMYWVTINLDTKETKFSKTLAEHLVYVDQYNEWCAANEGRCT